MKMSNEKEELKVWHNYLQNTGMWYVDTYAPDISEFQDIAEKAKTYANAKLSKMTTNDLYREYKKWVEKPKFAPKTEDQYEEFFNDLVFELGLSALKGTEKDLYCESCNLTLRFMRI